MVQVKDITDYEIIEACRAYHEKGAPTPDVSLSQKYPVKVIIKKMEKMLDKGLIECGVSLRTAWVVE